MLRALCMESRIKRHFKSIWLPVKHVMFARSRCVASPAVKLRQYVCSWRAGCSLRSACSPISVHLLLFSIPYDNSFRGVFYQGWYCERGERRFFPLWIFYSGYFHRREAAKTQNHQKERKNEWKKVYVAWKREFNNPCACAHPLPKHQQEGTHCTQILFYFVFMRYLHAEGSPTL